MIPWRRAWQPTPVFLSGESPWTEEPGVIQSVGYRVGHNQTYMPCQGPHTNFVQEGGDFLAPGLLNKALEGPSQWGSYPIIMVQLIKWSGSSFSFILETHLEAHWARPPSCLCTSRLKSCRSVLGVVREGGKVRVTLSRCCLKLFCGVVQAYLFIQHWEPAITKRNNEHLQISRLTVCKALSSIIWFLKQPCIPCKNMRMLIPAH